MTVLIHLETAVTLYLNVILTIDRYHGHLAQHVHNGLSLRFLIGLNIIGNAVDILLYELALGLYYHTV